MLGTSPETITTIDSDPVTARARAGRFSSLPWARLQRLPPGSGGCVGAACRPLILLNFVCSQGTAHPHLLAASGSKLDQLQCSRPSTQVVPRGRKAPLLFQLPPSPRGPWASLDPECTTTGRARMDLPRTVLPTLVPTLR